MIDRIRDWFRRQLREFLREEPPVSLTLEVFRKGQIKRYRAIQVVGLHLQCIPIDEANSLQLIRVSDAVDREQWWAIYEKLGGPALKWEDGSEFRPNSG